MWRWKKSGGRGGGGTHAQELPVLVHEQCECGPVEAPVHAVDGLAGKCKPKMKL